MVSKRFQSKQNSNMPEVPEDLAEDEAFSVTHTVHKSRHKNSEAPGLTAEDLSDAVWYIESQTEEGWAFRDEMEGKPIEADLRNEYGPGKYRLTPVLNSDKLTKFREVMRILPATGVLSNPVSHLMDEPDDDEDDYELPELSSSDTHSGRDWQDAEMPAWMRLQMQQAQEERAEARRRQEEAELRRTEWEREQATREWKKQEREERWQRERMQQEERERKERAEREERERREREERERRDRELREERDRRDREERNQMIQLVVQQGAGLLGTFLQSQNKTPERPDLNEVLLQSLLNNQQVQPNPAPQGNNLREQIEILALLDSLREAREYQGRRDEPEEKGSSGGDLIGKVMQILPLLGLGTGAGTGGMPNAQQLAALQQQLAAAQQGPAPVQLPTGVPQPQGVPHEDPLNVLKNEEAVAELAMRDPDGVAKSLVSAFNKNPALQQAVIKAASENP